MIYEWIGIAGSILIIIAFLNKDERTIRILDAVGALLFVIYGGLTQTWSTMTLNAVLIVVQIVRLIRIRRERRGK